MLIYIVYLLCVEKTRLSKGESACILVMALLTVVAGILLYELDKKYNTARMNSMYLKALSTIALVVVGVLIFKENYNIHQALGVVLILLGMYMTSIKVKI